jgi:hypothetical protein
MPISSSWTLMSFGLPLVDICCLAHGTTGYLDWNRPGRARSYLRPVRPHKGVTRSFAFFLVPWVMSTFRFPWYLLM